MRIWNQHEFIIAKHRSRWNRALNRTLNIGTVYSRGSFQFNFSTAYLKWKSDEYIANCGKYHMAQYLLLSISTKRVPKYFTDNKTVLSSCTSQWWGHIIFISTDHKNKYSSYLRWFILRSYLSNTQLCCTHHSSAIRFLRWSPSIWMSQQPSPPRRLFRLHNTFKQSNFEVS